MPGDGVSGTLKVRNQTAKALDVRARLVADLPDLNDLLHASLEADGTRLYDGPLGGLRRFSPEAARVASGETMRLDAATVAAQRHRARLRGPHRRDHAGAGFEGGPAMKSSTPRKILATLLVLSLMAAISGGATVSALQSETENPGNTFAAGSVGIPDNDGGLDRAVQPLGPRAGPGR